MTDNKDPELIATGAASSLATGGFGRQDNLPIPVTSMATGTLNGNDTRTNRQVANVMTQQTGGNIIPTSINTQEAFGAGGGGGGGGGSLGMTYNTANIQKLNGTNFLPWRRQVTIVLKLRNLSAALEENSQANDRIDMAATLVLLETMDDAHKIQVQAEPTARAIMLALERQYANQSMATKHRLLAEYFKYQKQATHNVSQHVGKLKELRANLANLGEAHSEEMFQAVLINSLPPDFGDMMRMWDMMHPSQKTTEFLLNFLQQREQEVSSKPQVLGMHVQDKKRIYEERKKTSKCYSCGELGHFGRECPKRQENTQQAQTQRPKLTMTTILTTGNIDPSLKHKWIADSGASSHMCNDKGAFTKLDLFETPTYACVGDGAQIAVFGRGEVDIKIKVGKTESEATLSDVSFIPSLATNLYSISAATNKSDSSAIFSAKSIHIVRNGVTLAIGQRTEDDIYIMNFATKKQRHALAMTKNYTAKELHETLGHAGIDRIQKLLKDDQIPIAIKKIDDCAACPAGKGTRGQHPSRDEDKKATETGERVHMDLVHLNKQATYPYFLLCKDEYSEFTFIYPARKKSETASLISQHIVEFQVQSGKKIKRLKSDNGSEFCNSTLRQICQQEGIHPETSTEYEPQQNGLAERAVRTICTMARTILIDSAVGEELYVEAIKTAVYIHNIVPTTRSDLTPYERFHGRKPNLTNLVKFGSPAHVTIVNERLQKEEPRTRQGFMVGYTNKHNTYRVFIPELQRVIESSYIYFAPHKTEPSRECQCRLAEPENTNLATIITDTETPRIDTPENARNQEVVQVSNIESSPTLTPTTPASNPTAQIQVEGQAEQHRQLTREAAHGLTDESEHEYEEIQHLIHTSMADETTKFSDPTLSPTIIGKNGKPYIHKGELDTYFRDRYMEEQHESNASSTEDDEGLLTRIANRIPSIFLLAAMNDTSVSEPRSFKEALSGCNRARWQTAIEEELAAHDQNQTWRVCERPSSGTTLTARWVFKVKRNAQGAVERFKARLVARGYRQRPGLDYHLTYAPVARSDTIRAILALAVEQRKAIKYFDVTTAFLNGIIEETLHMEAPEGMKLAPNQCLKLEKALYGLKQAPRAWGSKFHETVIGLGFTQTFSDPCLYVHKTKTIYLAVYVDDGAIVAQTEAECLAVIADLNKHFRTNVVDGSTFLGLEIAREGDRMTLRQTRYIQDMLERFEMADSRPVSVPMLDTKALYDTESPKIEVPYQELIGSLLYCALSTRPDILFSTILLSTFNADPRAVHWNAAKRILKYLKGTQGHALVFVRDGSQAVKMQAFSDADWAGDSRARKSTTGVLVKMAGCSVIFRSKLQDQVARSTCTAEYVAACTASVELAWLRNLMHELGVETAKPQLLVDNLPAINAIKNESSCKSVRGLELKFHYVRQEWLASKFELDHVGSDQQLADVLTKAISGEKFKTLTHKLGIDETTPTSH